MDVTPIFAQYRNATDLRGLLACVRAFDAVAGDERSAWPAVRLAVTSNYSTQFLARGFPLALAARGIRADVWEGGYNAWQLDLLDPRSALYSFQPTHVLLALTSIDLAFGALRTPARVAKAVADCSRHVLERTDARVLVTLPEPLSEERSDQSAAYEWRRETCARLTAVMADPRITLIDLEPVVRSVGHLRWFDDRYYDVAKIPFHPDRTPNMLARLSDAVAGTVSPRTKLVIVDLDETLWGGVVGDDGWDGIDLDVAGAGRHHLRLQLFLKGVREQGVLLAIASKNDPAPVREVFEKRPEMILRFDDFIDAQIHWGPKSEGIARTLETLNLSPAGVFFVDDNPAEREEVRCRWPELSIPDLPDAPAEWVPFLIDTGAFDRRVVTEDSANRQRMYRENWQRDESRRSAPSVDDYLASLDMELIACNASEHRERVVELLQKTNQFNVTTRRYAWADVADVTQNGLALCYRLTDRFGDNGIISVVLVAVETDAACRLDAWVMSCRVMGRTVENAVMDDVLRRIKALGIGRVIGEYVATDKNAPVQGLYERLGFLPTDVPGRYEYPLASRHFSSGTPHVRVVDRTLQLGR